MSIGLLIDTREMGREASHKEDQGGQKHYIAKALDLERQVLSLETRVHVGMPNPKIPVSLVLLSIGLPELAVGLTNTGSQQGRRIKLHQISTGWCEAYLDRPIE